MASFSPTRRLSSVDFPAFGCPMSWTIVCVVSQVGGVPGESWSGNTTVNVKAFGWRLPFHVFPLQLIELLAVALFAALCAARLASPRMPWIEETLTIRPRRRSTIPGRTARQKFAAPVR